MVKSKATVKGGLLGDGEQPPDVQNGRSERQSQHQTPRCGQADAQQFAFKIIHLSSSGRLGVWFFEK